MKTCFVIATMSFMYLTLCVRADGALTWTGDGEKASWAEAGNWSDGTSAPAAAPMDGTVPLVFNALPERASPYRQVINVTDALSVGEVTEKEPLSFRREFSVSAVTTLGLLAAQPYLGFWKLTKNGVALNLCSGAELDMLCGGSLVLPNVDSGSAAISSLGAATVIDKRGSGNLSVGSAAGPGTVVHVEYGSVALNGTAQKSGPAPGAALRVDAGRLDTMEFDSDKGDGRRYISVWRDADGRASGIYKSLYTSSESWSVSFCTPPFISPVTANGMNLVDFGAATEANVGLLGPTNCAAQILRSSDQVGFKNVREIFYVGWITDDKGENAVLGSGTAYPLYRLGKTLFHSDLASPGVVYGDIYLNGRKRAADYISSSTAGDDIADLHVLSVASCVDLPLDLVGTDRYYARATGGMRIGEIILYTNNLTTAERISTHRYLMAKWMPAATDAGFGYDAVDIRGGNSGGGTLSVPEGRTASVAQIILPNTMKLTKTGAGKLEIGCLPQADATIEIQDGAVSFAAVEPFDDDQPAVSPSLWLDATSSSSLVPSDDGRISKWTDCREEKADTVYATSGTDRDAKNPYVITAAQNGLDSVCFGTSAEDRAWAKLTGCTSACEGFIAVRMYSNSMANVFGCGDLTFYRDTSAYLLHPTYAGNDGRAARWAVDGVVRNPIREGSLKSDGAWHVVNFASLKSLSAGYLVIDRRPGVNTAYGCCEIGEVLYYDRVLSAGERRQTEAYLMKRWLGKDHPAKASARSLPSVTFADGVPAVFDSDTDLSIGAVTSSGSSLTKKGAGAVELGSLSDDDAIRSVTVEGGTLVTPFVPLEDVSVFHFDASDAGSFEMDGTSIVKWNDVRGNGVYALSEEPKNGNASVAYPTLKSADTGDGTVRPYVDFGNKNEVTDDSSGGKQTESVLATKAAGMLIYNGSTSVREAHIIYADQTSGSRQHIFTSLRAYHFHRNGERLLAEYDQTANARNGYIAIDGVSCAANAPLPSGFHLVSMAPAGDTTINTIAADRPNSGRGGSRICEILAFNEALSEADRRFLQESLLYKWLGQGAKPYSVKELDSLVVREGACCRNSDSQVSLSVASFAGAGTVDFEKASVSGFLDVGDCETKVGTAAFTGDLALDDGATLIVDLVSSNEWDKVRIDGTFAQKGDVTLSLRNSAGQIPPAPCRFALLVASEFKDVDFERWSVALPEGYSGTARLYLHNGELGIDIRKIGMTLIVK